MTFRPLLSPMSKKNLELNLNEKLILLRSSQAGFGIILFWGAGIKLLLKSYMDKKVILCVFLLYHFHFIPIIFWLILFHNYQDLFDSYYTINLSSTNILLSDFNLLWKDKAFFCRFNLLNQRNTTKDFRTKLKSILMTHL